MNRRICCYCGKSCRRFFIVAHWRLTAHITCGPLSNIRRIRFYRP